MSTAKMVADSTQSDLPEKSATRKRKKIVQKKKVKRKKDNEKKSKKKISEEDFEEYDLDLENDIKPIGFYVKTRDKLTEQMFNCVKGASLQRALPDVLKDLPLVDLKRRCLEQLEVMSKKRIRRICAGDDPATISSSGTDDETTDEQDPDDSETPVADSTSLYTQGLGDSDRELDDHEEGSLGHSSRSPTPSDDEPMYAEQDEDQFSECTYIEQATKVDGETEMEGENVENTAEEVKKTPLTEEEAEEGEVIDDCVVEGDEHVLDKQITDKEEIDSYANEYEVKDSTDELEDTPNKVMGVISQDEMTTEEVNESDKDEGEICDENEEYEKYSKAIENTENKLVEEELGEHSSDGTNDGCEESNSSSDNEQSNIKDTLVVRDDNDDETPDADVSISDSVVSEVKEQKQKGGRVVVPPSIAPVLTRNQMELLELEMRARAIKAMLKTAK